MIEPADTFEVKGIKCEIHYDQHAGNPYDEFDQLGELLSDVRDYTFGTKYDFSRFKSTRHAARYLTLCESYAIAIPFVFQDYGSSGALAYLDTPDDVSSDYPRIDGFLVVSKQQFEEEGMDLEKTEAAARAGFNEFAAYVAGEVFGYRAAPGDEDEDSCWGYYGSLDYVKAEATRAAEYIAHERWVNEEPSFDVAEALAGA